jgi:2-polyprenyl-6-methoxyphenol hydroxylase-like FAD-dependent oxidoreductase
MKVNYAAKNSNVKETMTDVLISGGGLAGSALAILLGRRGLCVELFERGEFPKEKPCGEGLMPAGVAVLNRLGVAEAVGGVPFCGVRYHVRNQVAEGRFPAVAGLAVFGSGQRRKHLDQVLFRTAAAVPGVTAHTGAQVDAPLIEKGRAVGLLVNGKPHRAPLIVAADGAHSRLRRLMGLSVPVRRKRLGMRAHFRLAPGQVHPPWVDIFLGPGHELYVTPLPERELLVVALADGHQFDATVASTFQRWVFAQPELARRLEGAEQVTPHLATSPVTEHARTGVAPGFALLGDAAGSLDPITGGGMAQALMSAELLARYVPERLGPDDSWLGDFECARRSFLFDYRVLTRMVLWMTDHPQIGEPLLLFLKTVPSFFSHLIGVSGGVRRLVVFPWSRELDFKAARRNPCGFRASHTENQRNGAELQVDELVNLYRAKREF